MYTSAKTQCGTGMAPWFHNSSLNLKWLTSYDTVPQIKTKNKKVLLLIKHDEESTTVKT